MNAVDYAISRIKLKIPTELLELAFKPDTLWQRRDLINQDWHLRTDVIEKVVGVDLNVIGGEHVRIPLDTLNPVAIEGAYIYEIPLSLTQGKYISRVISIGWGGTSSGAGTVEDRILAATDPYQSDQSAALRLVGPNTIAVEEGLRGSITLKCVLNYDPNFTSIDQAYWRDFAHLCTVATEMLIYKRLRIRLSSGSFNAGTPNDGLMDFINEMADAHTRYGELLDTKWTKLAIMSDHQAKMDMIGYTLGGWD